MNIPQRLKIARWLLGAIGTVGLVGWGFFTWLSYFLLTSSSYITAGALLVALWPMAVFVFYLYLAVREYPAQTVRTVGIVMHTPLLFVVYFLFRVGGTGPFFALALLPGLAVWLVYVLHLFYDDTAA